jgi:hypothetical protein
MWFLKKKVLQEETKEVLLVHKPVLNQLVLIIKEKKFSYGFVKALYKSSFVVGDCSNGSDWITNYIPDKEDSKMQLMFNVDGSPALVSDDLKNDHILYEQIVREDYLEKLKRS